MAARTYAPYIVFPAAVVIGATGYMIESSISDRSTPSQTTSIEEERSNRLVRDLNTKDPSKIESLKEHSYVPRGVLTKNLSPSLDQQSG